MEAFHQIQTILALKKSLTVKASALAPNAPAQKHDTKDTANIAEIAKQMEDLTTQLDILITSVEAIDITFYTLCYPQLTATGTVANSGDRLVISEADLKKLRLSDVETLTSNNNGWGSLFNPRQALFKYQPNFNADANVIVPDNMVPNGAGSVGPSPYQGYTPLFFDQKSNEQKIVTFANNGFVVISDMNCIAGGSNVDNSTLIKQWLAKYKIFSSVVVPQKVAGLNHTFGSYKVTVFRSTTSNQLM